MKSFDLVRLKTECGDSYKGIISFADRLIFMGEINQMPGHGVFVTMGKNKWFTGMHTDSFEVIPEDEA